MPELFQSPSSQAASAAQTQAGLSNQEIQQLEQYVSGGEQAQRSAIEGMGPNPYFEAAGKMSPSAYAVNPSNTTNFSSSPTGTPVISGGTASPFSPAAPTMANPFAPATTSSAAATPSSAPAGSPPPAPGSPAAILPPGMVPPGFVPGQGNGSPMQGSGGD